MISVIIPVKNGAATIQKCLQAVLAQEGLEQPYEVFVVDDGSTDNTRQLVEQLGVQVISQPNAGPAAARNTGVRAAHGEIILFTDADCVPLPGWISEMIRPFDDLLVAGVKGIYQTQQTALMARIVQMEFEERYMRLANQTSIDFVDTYSAAFRTQIFRQVGGFDEAFPYADNEDVDLSFRIAKAGYKMVFNPLAVVTHTHPDSLSRYFKLKLHRAYWRTIIYRLHPDKILKDSYTPLSLKLQILSMYSILLTLFAGIFWPSVRPLLLAEILFLLVITLPYVRQVYRRDAWLALPALLAVIARSFAFCLGMPAGVLGSFGFKRRLARQDL